MRSTLVFIFLAICLFSCQDFEQEPIEIDNFKMISMRNAQMQNEISIHKTLLKPEHNIYVHNLFDSLYLFYDELINSIIDSSGLYSVVSHYPTKLSKTHLKSINDRKLPQRIIYTENTEGMANMVLLEYKRSELRKYLYKSGLKQEILEVYLLESFVLSNHVGAISFDHYFRNLSVIQALFFMRLEQERLMNLQLIILLTDWN